MANLQHVELIKKGLAAWNEWRKAPANERPHLEQADLRGADLAGAHLDGVSMENALLEGCNLTGASLVHARLSGSRLQAATLRSADLRGATLREAILDSADLGSARMRGADLRGASLKEASLANCDLRTANLQATDFRGARDLSRTRLTQARNYCLAFYGEAMQSDLGLPPNHAERLQARDLDGYQLEDMDLVRADLSGFNLQEAALSSSDLRGAVLRDAILEGACLRWACLDSADAVNAKVRGAILEFANLSGGDFRQADLSDADLTFANFDACNFEGADLRGCRLSWRNDARDLRRARNVLLARLSPDACAALGFPEDHCDRLARRNFRGYDLRELDLKSGNLAGADLAGTDASRANMTDANLTGANLEGTNLDGSDLSRAVLTRSRLVSARCRRAVVEGAILEAANVQGADFATAVGLASKQWRDADNWHLGMIGDTLRAELELPDGHNQHIQKLEFAGYDFRRGRLRGAVLKGADLRRANLQGVDLSEANLESADLGGADLNGAVLVRASFKGALLNDVVLRDADLRDSELKDAKLLSGGQLGAANVSGASLPERVAAFDALQSIREASENARKIFVGMLVLCLYSWLTIAATRDAQLLTNTGLLQLPIVQTQIPVTWFYWVMPVLVLGVYFYCHFYLQNLWEELARMPAYFPDGRPLHQRVYPWLLNSLAREHFATLRPGRTTMTHLQYWTSILLTWWTTPFTLVIFWARYLSRHDRLGTSVLIVAATAAITGGSLLFGLATSSLRGETPSNAAGYGGPRWVWVRIGWKPGLLGVAVALILGLLSWGAIDGPPDSVTRRQAGLSAADPRAWVPVLLQPAGIRNVANLESDDVSIKPANWTGGTNKTELDLVKGAGLSGRDLRYARARRAFLVNANLRGANLEGAVLEEADLRGADLSGTNLRHANLRQAKLAGASLDKADLTGAALDGVIWTNPSSVK